MGSDDLGELGGDFEIRKIVGDGQLNHTQPLMGVISRM